MCSTNQLRKSKPNVHSLRHVGLACEDLERSIFFWKDILDFQVFWDKIEPEPYISRLLGFEVGGLRTVKLRSSAGDIIELLHFSQLEASGLDQPRNLHRSIGITHLAFTVPDIKKSLAKLRMAGFEPISRPLESPNGGVLVAYLKGPDNVLLEFVEDTGGITSVT